MTLDEAIGPLTDTYIKLNMYNKYGEVTDTKLMRTEHSVYYGGHKLDSRKMSIPEGGRIEIMIPCQ